MFETWAFFHAPSPSNCVLNHSLGQQYFLWSAGTADMTCTSLPAVEFSIVIGSTRGTKKAPGLEHRETWGARLVLRLVTEQAAHSNYFLPQLGPMRISPALTL
ncbi:MAG: hypothetical protein WCC92_15935 [Candidatus Korobacteraceae bacterium]